VGVPVGNTYLEDRESDGRVVLRWTAMCWVVDVAES
jgi:hypothetical protein